MSQPSRASFVYRGLVACWTLALLASALASGCGGGGNDTASVAAVSLDSGKFGALMASNEGHLLLPLVSRDPTGAVSGNVRGALWIDTNGSRIAVFLNPETGLPGMTVMGDLILLFRNWDTVAGTVDIATVFGPSGYVEIFRDVSIPEAKVASLDAGMIQSALTCFPACDTELENLSELLKVGGTALSIGGCVAATTLSYGAMALPCAGALLSAATLVTPEDFWLEDMEQTGRILALTDALKCSKGGALDCVAFFNTVATEAMDLIDDSIQSQQPMLELAKVALDSEALSGPVVGTPPACGTGYECTPGSYLPCYPTGTRKCGPDCTWSECPPDDTEPPIDESCPVNADEGEDVCAALVETVEAQCDAKGGKIIGWGNDIDDCIEGYECWATQCPCLLYCSEKCVDDMSCATDCLQDAGVEIQTASAACRDCPVPSIEAQCGISAK